MVMSAVALVQTGYHVYDFLFAVSMTELNAWGRFAWQGDSWESLYRRPDTFAAGWCPLTTPQRLLGAYRIAGHKLLVASWGSNKAMASIRTIFFAQGQEIFFDTAASGAKLTQCRPVW